MVTVSQSASLTVSGINVSTGPSVVLLANPVLSASSVQHADYIAETYVVNPSTTDVTLPMGKINLARLLWIATNIPITVTVTQNSVDRDIDVDSFLLLNGQYTAVKLTNASATAVASIAVVLTGDRPAASGAGLF